jgi:hypothetical protein
MFSIKQDTTLWQLTVNATNFTAILFILPITIKFIYVDSCESLISIEKIFFVIAFFAHLLGFLWNLLLLFFLKNFRRTDFFCIPILISLMTFALALTEKDCYKNSVLKMFYSMLTLFYTIPLSLIVPTFFPSTVTITQVYPIIFSRELEFFILTLLPLANWGILYCLAKIISKCIRIIRRKFVSV